MLCCVVSLCHYPSTFSLSIKCPFLFCSGLFPGSNTMIRVATISFKLDSHYLGLIWYLFISSFYLFYYLWLFIHWDTDLFSDVKKSSI